MLMQWSTVSLYQVNVKTNQTHRKYSGVNNITLNTTLYMKVECKCFFGSLFKKDHWKIFSGMPAKPTTITLPSLKKKHVGGKIYWI